jgi:uncharacterized membrane protein
MHKHPRRTLVAYLSAAGVFLALDATWLTLTNERLYRPALAHLMIEGGGFNALPAALFYAVYLAGIVGFAVAPAWSAATPARWTGSARRGAALGFVAYATYDLTNQATLRGWPWSLTLADLCWGSFATAVAAAVASAVTARTGFPTSRDK